MAPPDVDLTVYPDECDSFGHLNQASFLSLFERARWEMLARGPGMDFFTRAGSWPAVRKAEIEYHAPAFPGDVLRFQSTLLHVGHTSFTLRQSATVAFTMRLTFLDLDRDGDADLVSTHASSGGLRLWRASAGRFDPPTNYASGRT